MARYCGKAGDSTIRAIALFNRFHDALTDTKRLPAEARARQRFADNSDRVLLGMIGWQRIIFQRRIEKVVHALVNQFPQTAARYEETRVCSHSLFERTGDTLTRPQIVLLRLYYHSEGTVALSFLNVIS